MNKTQKAIVKEVDSRGYLKGWPPDELGARQVVKLVEEMGELSAAVRYHDPDCDWMEADLLEAAKCARLAFDGGDCGFIFDADTAVKEAADCYVVLSVLTHALEQMLGRDIDLEALALQKATGDVARGVR